MQVEISWHIFLYIIWIEVIMYFLEVLLCGKLIRGMYIYFLLVCHD